MIQAQTDFYIISIIFINNNVYNGQPTVPGGVGSLLTLFRPSSKSESCENNDLIFDLVSKNLCSKAIRYEIKEIQVLEVEKDYYYYSLYS